MTDKPETFELRLTAMAHGGHALGRYEGRTIFVPYTIPGEIVEARTVSEKSRVTFAEGVRLIQASADRVFPECPHFGPGRCGRCQWQHIDYHAQMLLKQDVLADQLARIGGFDDADVRDIQPSPLEWGYNYRMTLYNNGRGGFGFMSAVEGQIADMDECLILHPDLLELYHSIDLDAERINRMILQLGTDGAHMIILRVQDEDDAPELDSDLGTSVNLILPENEPINLIGDSHSVYEVAGHTFRVTAGSFFRSNVSVLEPLVNTVLEALEGYMDGAVFDLYSGVGLFAAFIAPHVPVVTTVESYPPAATDADVNLEDFDNVDILEGPVEDVLDALDLEDTQYRAAVIDPPPEGLNVDVMDQLGESGLPRLVYVSSDPATLARDAKRLANQGYELGVVHPIDMNPQTYFVDAVAVFDRA